MAKPFGRILLAVLLIAAGSGAARAAATAGSVVGISGACFIESEGKRLPLKLGADIHVADTLDVPAGGKLKLRMADGSILSVAAGTQLTVAAYNIDADGKRHDATLSLGQGLLHAVVSPGSPPAPFEVDTAVGAAGVRSTDWFIEAQPGETVVGVMAGSVALTGKATGATVVIPARSGARVSTGQDPTPPIPWKQAQFNALLARTELAQPQPQRRPPSRSGAPAEEYAPPAAPNPPGGGYYPPSTPYGQPPAYNPPAYNPPAPGYYNPGRGYEPGGGYNPRPGGSYGQSPGGGYTAPSSPGRY